MAVGSFLASGVPLVREWKHDPSHLLLGRCHASRGYLPGVRPPANGDDRHRNDRAPCLPRCCRLCDSEEGPLSRNACAAPFVVLLSKNRMTIEPVTIHDAQAITTIARENGLPESWSWPEGAHGAVARSHGHIVSFCAVKEFCWGIMVEEWWCVKTPEGKRGLLQLGQWFERTVARLATERGEEIKIGGLVRKDNPVHAWMLKSRGYAPEAEILTKIISPQSKQEVA